MLADIPILDANPDVQTVADELVARSLIPESACLDALHIATAALAGVQYLLTQNCQHIANATYQPIINDVCGAFGYSMPVICTSDQLLGDDNGS